MHIAAAGHGGGGWAGRTTQQYPVGLLVTWYSKLLVGMHGLGRHLTMSPTHTASIATPDIQLLLGQVGLTRQQFVHHADDVCCLVRPIDINQPTAGEVEATRLAADWLVGPSPAC
jgi:hypothetical protein